MANNWKKSALDALKKTKDSATEAASQVQKKYDSLDVKTKVERTSSQLKQVLEESGLSDTLKSASKSVDHQLSTLSGQKVLELVEERLALQAQYNDLLAEKLEQALLRIETLESESGSLRKAK